MMAPSLSITTVDASSGIELEVLLQPTTLKRLDIPGTSAEHFLKIPIGTSQRALRMSISGLPEGHSAAALRNGAHWPFQRFGSTLISQFFLTDDIEQHTIACVVAGVYGFSAQLSVLVQRHWAPLEGGAFQAPKWSEFTAIRELDRYLQSRPKSAQHRSHLDGTPRALSSESASRRETIQALHNATIGLCTFLTTQRRSVLLRSLAEIVDDGIDQDATLEALRQHPSWLVERVSGPISVGKKTYTATFVAPDQTQSSRLDLSVPKRIIGSALQSLADDPDLLTSKLLLEAVQLQLSRLNQVRRRVTNADISTWVSRDLTDKEPARLRTLILRVARLCTLVSSRTQPQRGGLSGLSNSFRDFDLFEWSVFAAIGSAIGAPTDSVSLEKTVLRGTQSTVINVNKTGGAALARELLPGWRDNSIMPAEYLPDFIVKYRDGVHIPVDAKFRVARTFGAPCSPDSLKEVQAYMNDFGLNGAVIIVPMIPASVAAFGGAHSELISGQINGREYRIWVVEHDPSVVGFNTALNAALTDIGKLADAQAFP